MAQHGHYEDAANGFVIHHYAGRTTVICTFVGGGMAPQHKVNDNQLYDASLHCGENCAKLEGLKEQKKYLLFFKRANLAQFLP